MYILDSENYDKDIKEVYNNLTSSIEEINKLFDNTNFLTLVDDLKEYDDNVEKHYGEYLETNKIWNIIKNDIVKKQDF